MKVVSNKIPPVVIRAVFCVIDKSEHRMEDSDNIQKWRGPTLVRAIDNEVCGWCGGEKKQKISEFSHFIWRQNGICIVTVAAVTSESL